MPRSVFAAPSDRHPPGPAETARWVAPVLLVVAAAVATVTVFAGVHQVLAHLAVGAGSALLTLTAVLPLALVAAWRRPGAPAALLVSAFLVLVSWCVLRLPRVGVFAGAEWNWQGKLVDLVWLVVLFAVLWPWARTQTGVAGAKAAPGTLGVALGVIAGWFGAVAVVVFVASAVAQAPAASVTWDRLLFDTTYPNLAEELLWRGVVLAVLDRVLGTPWRFFGAPVGWGLVLTSVGFGVGHGLFVEPSGIVLDPGAIVVTGVAGVALGWVRAYTARLWPAFLAHCAPEVGTLVGAGAWIAVAP